MPSINAGLKQEGNLLNIYIYAWRRKQKTGDVFVEVGDLIVYHLPPHQYKSGVLMPDIEYSYRPYAGDIIDASMEGI